MLNRVNLSVSGIDLAVQEINESKLLAEGTLQIIWEDTAGNKEQAVRAFNKLINEDQVVAIFGPYFVEIRLRSRPNSPGDRCASHWQF